MCARYIVEPNTQKWRIKNNVYNVNKAYNMKEHHKHGRTLTLHRSHIFSSIPIHSPSSSGAMRVSIPQDEAVPWHGVWLEEAMEEGTVDLPQPVAWEGCMSEEVCCLAHVEVTDHHQAQLQRWIKIIIKKEKWLKLTILNQSMNMRL